MTLPDLRRGHVVDVDLEPTRGSEQGKRRPCVVVQHDVLNRFSPNTIIVPATDADHVKKLYETNVLVKQRESNGAFSKDSVILCNQVRAVSKERIQRIYGKLSADLMRQIDTALKHALFLS